MDWINPTGARKVHSLIDKVYQRKNLEVAWEKVKANRGSGGVDGQSLEAFAAQLDQQLDRLVRVCGEEKIKQLVNRHADFDWHSKSVLSFLTSPRVFSQLF